LDKITGDKNTAPPKPPTPGKPVSIVIELKDLSPEKQAELYEAAIRKYGSPEAARKWVAPPGRSKHNAGLAVDFANAQGSLLRDASSREAQWIRENAGRFGLDVPMSWEPWQVELAGARGQRPQPQPQSNAFAAMAPGQPPANALAVPPAPEPPRVQFAALDPRAFMVAQQPVNLLGFV
jgi:hypothetical protein